MGPRWWVPHSCPDVGPDRASRSVDGRPGRQDSAYPEPLMLVAVFDSTVTGDLSPLRLVNDEIRCVIGCPGGNLSFAGTEVTGGSPPADVPGGRAFGALLLDT